MLQQGQWLPSAQLIGLSLPLVLATMAALASTTRAQQD
jgi:hypothetical protein